MQKSERVNFGSKIGAILAAAGSAVGLGNIWRFPLRNGKSWRRGVHFNIFGVCPCIRHADYDGRVYSRTPFKGEYG